MVAVGLGALTSSLRMVEAMSWSVKLGLLASSALETLESSSYEICSVVFSAYSDQDCLD